MIIIHTIEARDQLAEVYGYYETQQLGLGDRFEAAYREFLTLIRKLPRRPIMYGNIRSRSMSRFPYRVFYRFEEAAGRIEVLAVLHAARNPATWPGQES